MSIDPKHALSVARERLVKRRRQLAETIGTGTVGLAEDFVTVQAAIDSIDRAIEDEKRHDKTQAMGGGHS